MFWTALYVFPLIWVALLFVGILKLYETAKSGGHQLIPFMFSNISFLPIVMLALIFNVTNTVSLSSRLLRAGRLIPTILQVGFTYADRDAKRKWATGMAASSMLSQFGGVG